MNRRVLLAIVASLTLIFSCKPKTDSSESSWKQVYENAYKNHDYMTAVVALNQLVISDTVNKADYIDSLAFYNIKKLANFDAGQKYTDMGLLINPDNALLLEFKTYFLGMQGKVDEAMFAIQKAYKISGLNKHKYLYASMEVEKTQDIKAYIKTINEILYGSSKKETFEVNVDQNTTQVIDLKASCYLDKAKISLSDKDLYMANKYIDSALMLSPNFQMALYFKEELNKGSK